MGFRISKGHAKQFSKRLIAFAVLSFVVCGKGIAGDDPELGFAPGFSPLPETGEQCGDGIDNDKNGRTDCEELTCDGYERPARPINAMSFSVSEIDSVEIKFFTVCRGQKQVEVARPPEYSTHPERCRDGISNERREAIPQVIDGKFVDASRGTVNPLWDTAVDCSDSECCQFEHCKMSPNCGGSPIKAEYQCSDKEDDDGDGLVDCLDPDCKNNYVCTLQENLRGH